MGTIHHHGILVTGHETSELERARNKAIAIGLEVSNFGNLRTNGFRSFAVFPDGSKEYWDLSELGNGQREEFKEYLRERGPSLYWVEVGYGELGVLVEDGYIYDEEPFQRILSFWKDRHYRLQLLKSLSREEREDLIVELDRLCERGDD